MKLQDVNGIFQRSEASKGQIAINYFSNLFKSSNSVDYFDLLKDCPVRVSSSMNLLLTRKFTSEEVREAVFSIKPDSAPGADGISGFYSKNIGILLEINSPRRLFLFFETGVMPPERNYTQLCLIPKKPNAELMSDLRPISLCSVMYKTISKILASRIQHLLHVIVSPTQSAFVSQTTLY